MSFADTHRCAFETFRDSTDYHKTEEKTNPMLSFQPLTQQHVFSPMEDIFSKVSI